LCRSGAELNRCDIASVHVLESSDSFALLESLNLVSLLARLRQRA
jgi:hypothetical protein